jgi:DNA adenine methylase
MSFPPTKYMGSKQVLLPFIIDSISHLKFDTVLDAFSGSACVAYEFKQRGCQVHSNDFLRFAFRVAHATIENNATLLDEDDLDLLLRRNKRASTFIQETFANLYFEREEDAFLDNLWANIQQLKNPLKRSLALASACRAAMKKRPRGIFTFTGKKGWDGRNDLKLTLREQFLEAVRLFNAAVFSNRRRNRAFCANVFDVDPEPYDLVYIDPPYVSPYSDCDYTRRYHFLEGLCTYWNDVELMPQTLTKKIRSYPTDFSTKDKALEAFRRLFEHFSDSTLVISYSSNAIPSKVEMVRLLKEYKKNVEVKQINHRYSHGNHNHKVGDNNNSVFEYLYIAR